MAKQITHITVFLASPSDLAEERAIVKNVVNGLNVITRATMNVHLELLAWETDAYPSAGIDAQDVINNQIGNDYDIFIGIMWKKFGTPTSRAGSGTEEEFNIAYKKHVENKGATKIMLYFSDKPIAPKDIDIEGISKINNFRERAEKLGILHWSFNSESQLENILKIHLINQVKDVKKELDDNNTQEVGGVQIEDKSVIHVPVEHEDADEEMGYLDLMELFLDNMSQVRVVMVNMGSHVEELGEQMAIKTNKIDIINKSPNKSPHSFRLLTDRSASDINNYVQLTNVELLRYRELFTAGIDAFSNVLTLMEVNKGEIDLSELEGLLEEIIGAKTNIGGLAQSVVGFRDTMEKWPSVSKTLSRANKILRSTLTELIKEFTDSETLLGQLQETVERLLLNNQEGDSSVEEV
jgi:hypothetical protein